MKMVTCKFAQNKVAQQRFRVGSKKSVQQGRSHFYARSVHLVREHGKMARTPLAAFFNRPMQEGVRGCMGKPSNIFNRTHHQKLCKTGPGVYRTWGIEREKAAEQGQIVTISLVPSGTMGQSSGELWIAETPVQPILPKFDKTLGPFYR
jgi:hypothetical protein